MIGSSILPDFPGKANISYQRSAVSGLSSHTFHTPRTRTCARYLAPCTWHPTPSPVPCNLHAILEYRRNTVQPRPLGGEPELMALKLGYQSLSWFWYPDEFTVFQMLQEVLL